MHIVGATLNDVLRVALPSGFGQSMIRAVVEVVEPLDFVLVEPPAKNTPSTSASARKTTRIAPRCCTLRRARAFAVLRACSARVRDSSFWRARLSVPIAGVRYQRALPGYE